LPVAPGVFTGPSWPDRSSIAAALNSVLRLSAIHIRRKAVSCQTDASGIGRWLRLDERLLSHAASAASSLALGYFRVC